MLQASRKPGEIPPAPSSEDSDSDSNSSDPETINLSHKRPPSTQAQAQVEPETQPETVQVSFDFCDFRDADTGMTRALLAQGAFASVPKVNDMLHELETCIVSQKAVGTTIRVDDAANDGEIYSFLTVLPYQRMKQRSSVVKELHKFAVKHCPEALRERFEAICAAESTGLLVNERIVNMPRELAQPLHSAVLEDVKWAKENAGEGKEVFGFERLVVLCPIVDFATKSGPGGGEGERKKRRKREQVVYQKFDEEALVDAAELQFRCPLQPRQQPAAEGQKDQSKGAVPQRHQPKEAVFVSLSIKAYQQAVDNIATFM